MSNASENDLILIKEAFSRISETSAHEAFTMPGAFYTSENFLKEEQEQLFRKKWVCVGRAEEVPEAGCYFATDLIGEPIVIVRTSNNEIKALSNVCRHRAMPLLSGQGKTRRITCSYHAWNYDLDGKLLRAPEIEKHRKDFLEDCRLPELNCECWHGFIFVNLDTSSESFLDSSTVKHLEPMIENMHIEDMRLLFSAEQEWEVNWKCLVENFLEGYHLSTVHRKTLHPYTPTRLSKHFPAQDDFFGFYSRYPEDAPRRGESHPDLTEEESRQSLMVGIGPGSVFGISGFKVTYNLIQPVSATRLRTKIGMIGIESKTDEEKRVADAGVDLFKRTFAEDEQQLVNQMKGLQSRYYQSSILARPDYEGCIWDFYNYMSREISL
jgi:phenylpropionate dioxygenase-like ring-hydroxylating dioxygenase large terminal subunit